MGLTAAEKVLARTADRSVVRPGDVVVCRPDLIVQLDALFGVEGLWFRPTTVADPERIAIVFDHAVPAPSVLDAAAMSEGRSFAAEFGIDTIFDVGNHGISHVLLAEVGMVLPGELVICPDSHTCAGGAFNCAARGVGPIDTLQAIVRGVIWFLVCPTVRYNVTGALRPFTGGKDAFFSVAVEHGSHANLNLEFGGPGLGTLALNDRRTIATMCAEVGAEFSMFDHDQVVDDYLRGRHRRPYEPANADPDAEYSDVRVLDLDAVEPFVILPDSVPGNGMPVRALGHAIPIDQAFIGSCANGQIEDLRAAASIVSGRRIARGTRLIVTPATQAIYLQAIREGLIETLVEAGAVVTNPTCGACYGRHMGVVGPGETCLTASTRNFRGRMGSSEANIFMGAVATVAASAVTGVITDPRDL